MRFGDIGIIGEIPLRWKNWTLPRSLTCPAPQKRKYSKHLYIVLPVTLDGGLGLLLEIFTTCHIGNKGVLNIWERQHLACAKGFF